MNTGELIAQLRNKNKISQSALANDLHIGQSTLAMYEKGKRNPNLEMISKIADYFNVTTDYLLGREVEESEPVTSKAQLIAAHIDDNVSDEEMGKITSYIEFLKTQKKK